jgi:hypothetical protein
MSEILKTDARENPKEENSNVFSGTKLVSWKPPRFFFSFSLSFSHCIYFASTSW